MRQQRFDFDPRQPRDKLGRFAAKRGVGAIAVKKSTRVGEYKTSSGKTGESGKVITEGEQYTQKLHADKNFDAAHKRVIASRDEIYRQRKEIETLQSQGKRIPKEKADELNAASKQFHEDHVAFQKVAAPKMAELKDQMKQDSGVSREQAEKIVDGKQVKATWTGIRGDELNRVRLREDLVDYTQMTGYDSPSIKKATVSGLHTRSFADPMNSKQLVISNAAFNRGEVFHEASHHLEYNNPKLVRAAEDWQKKRGDNGGRKIRLALADPAYHPSETAIKDTFWHIYAGKNYQDASGKTIATEALSMGMQCMDTPERMASLYAVDPEHFNFTVGAIAANRKRKQIKSDSVVEIKFDYNPYRDNLGRFASKSGGNSKVKSPKQLKKYQRRKTKWSKKTLRQAYAVAGVTALVAAAAATEIRMGGRFRSGLPNIQDLENEWQELLDQEPDEQAVQAEVERIMREQSYEWEQESESLSKELGNTSSIYETLGLKENATIDEIRSAYTSFVSSDDFDSNDPGMRELIDQCDTLFKTTDGLKNHPDFKQDVVDLLRNDFSGQPRDERGRFAKKEAVGMGVWYEGRRTGVMVDARSKAEAKEKADKLKKQGGDGVANIRELDEKEVEQAKKGKWVRTGPHGEKPGELDIPGYGPKPKKLRKDLIDSLRDDAGYGVWFGGRRTPIAVAADNRSEAVSRAKKKLKRGGDNVVSARALNEGERSQAAKGNWIRTGPNGEAPGKSNLRGQGPKPKKVKP